MLARTKQIAAIASVLVGFSTFSHAAVLVGWTFEGTASNNLSPVVSGTTGITQTTLPSVAPETNPLGLTASLTANHASASKYYTGNGNGSATGFFSNAWAVGDYDQLAADLTGYDRLTLSVDASGSNTGPKNFAAQYSLDGSTFTQFATYDVPAPGGTSVNFSTSAYNAVFHFDLALPGAIQNVKAFRIVNLSTTPVAPGSTYGAGGTNRVDNLVISGTAIGAATPEPASLAAIAGATLCLVRRRR